MKLMQLSHKRTPTIKVGVGPNAFKFDRCGWTKIIHIQFLKCNCILKVTK
jgi:hypothetical protein